VCVCVKSAQPLKRVCVLKFQNAIEAGIAGYTPVTGLDISGLEVDLPRADYIVELV
jgi:hypothetical protein